VQAKSEIVQKVCDIVKKQLALPARKFECTRESKCTTLGVDSLNRYIYICIIYLGIVAVDCKS
jgi:hypothetical protein